MHRSANTVRTPALINCQRVSQSGYRCRSFVSPIYPPRGQDRSRGIGGARGCSRCNEVTGTIAVSRNERIIGGREKETGSGRGGAGRKGRALGISDYRLSPSRFARAATMRPGPGFPVESRRMEYWLSSPSSRGQCAPPAESVSRGGR